jgi:protein TonB
MLAYAAQNPRPAGRTGSPKALMLILAGHGALIAAVMTARMDIGSIIPADPTEIFDVTIAPPPEPEPQVRNQPQPHDPQQSFIESTPTIVDMEATSPLSVDRGQALEDIATVIGTEVSLPSIDPPLPAPARVAARFNTPPDAVRPPYPNDKLRQEEEATLRLKLTIDARGRVTAVEPVGTADPSFLNAARRHILRAWRYKPATVGGSAITSSTVISLSFRLEEA